MPLILRRSPLRWPVALVLGFVPASVAAAPPSGAHPLVPGFERFFTGPKADAARGGQMLLGELYCASCHQPDAGLEPLLLRKQAPILDGLSGRVKIGYLRKFLSDPQSVKPGTTMPNLFAGVGEADRKLKVEELVHFLASSGSLQHQPPDRKSIKQGQDLYGRVGCVVCHGSHDKNGKEEKLFATSVPLGDLAAKYTIPSLTAFLENPHRVRPSGRMPGLLKAKEAREVANYLLQAIPYAAPPTNMKYAYYEGGWSQLPDFAKLKPLTTGEAAGFDMSVARRQNEMALAFEGYLKVAKKGTYQFHLTSDDGSKLWIDDKLVVSNDGVHPPQSKSGKAKLEAGTHKFFAAVFNAGGGVELHVDIEGNGIGRQSITPMVFLAPMGNPVKKPAQEDKNDDAITLDTMKVEKGRQLFASLGCASCHQLHEGAKTIASTLAARPLAKLKPSAGCLSAMPAKGLPHYALTEPQQAALTAALQSLPAAAPMLGPKEIIARTMTTFNCYACHDRDKTGGVEDSLNKHFTTNQQEMGEEGRIPPTLDGVGAKLTLTWFKKILAEGAQERPYMYTRMPKFGEQNTGQVIEAFRALDKVAPTATPKFKQKPAKVKAIARHLVGGLALGCVKCHTFAGSKAEGIQAIDMMLMTQRLNRDWFHMYLLDPQKIRPLTRMPSAWPMGQSTLPDVLEGDATKQIEAIWLYLSDGKKAALPVGFGKHFIPLTPEKDAIIYRNFIEGAGSRAIGVGYPEKVNIAFDANNMRLAMIWQGAFIDASRHWTDRGVGYQPPLGDNVLNLPAGPTFAVLAKQTEPWPTAPAKELGYQFHGYRLTPDQRPTFLYAFNGIKIEDFANAVEGKAGVLRRKLTLASKQPVPDLWFRAATGSKIESKEKGWYLINGEWRIHVEAVAEPIIRSVGGQQELLVPVRFGKDNKATVVQEFAW